MMKLGGWCTRAVFDRYNLVDVDDEPERRWRNTGPAEKVLQNPLHA